ncbi:MAG: glycosyltransferase family 2 protein [Candidatus Eisenbacteria bacterium]
MRISATVITFNEERDLDACLRSLDWCDEIVVVDSGSQDRTQEIAQSHGARVVVRPFEGFSAQKNFAAQEARGDWIFSVDADEVVGPELRDEIKTLLGSGPKEVGFYVPRRNVWLETEIRHGGWYPDHTLRLYRRDAGRWEGHSHEKVVVTGSTRVLRGALVHRTIRDLHDHLRKGLLSAVLELKEAKANKLRLYGWFPVSVLWMCLRDFWSGSKSELGIRAIYKARVKNRVAVRWLLPLYPAFRFAYMYILRGGFLDGNVGFWLAYNSAIVESMKCAKFWEHYVYHRGTTPAGEASLEDTRTLYRSMS